MKRGKREKTFWNIAGNVVTKRQKGVFSRSVTGDVSEKNRPIDPRSKWQRDGGCLVPDVISVADRESSIFTSSRGRIDVTRRDSLPRSFLPFFPLISLFFFILRHSYPRHSLLLPRFPDVSPPILLLDDFLRQSRPRSFFHATLTSLLHAFHSLFHFDSLNY